MYKPNFNSVFSEVDVRHTRKIKSQLIFDFKAIANIKHEGHLTLTRRITSGCCEMKLFYAVLTNQEILLFGDQTKTELVKRIGVNWKRCESFIESNPEFGHCCGFRLISHEKVYTFIVLQTEELDLWTDNLANYSVQLDLSQDYEIIKEIGSGTNSTCYLGESIEDDEKCVIKSLPKEALSDASQDGLSRLVNEIFILRNQSHPNIVKVHRVYEDTQHVHIVQEHAKGGDLHSRIRQRKRFSEQTAQEFMRRMFQVLQYLHQQNIVHRDIKLENIVMKSKNDDTDFVLVDFGMAAQVTIGSPLIHRCGSPGYIAPEILNGDRYDTKVDIFSAGVIMYILLTGRTPFVGSNVAELVQQNQKCHVPILETQWADKSPEAMDLVARLLNMRPVERPSAMEALRHPWFSKQHAVGWQNPDTTTLALQKIIEASELHEDESVQDAKEGCPTPDEINSTAQFLMDLTKTETEAQRPCLPILN